MSKYVQTNRVKTGATNPTINGKQPSTENSYNILTHRNCNNGNDSNDASISVWCLSPTRDNQMYCADIEAPNSQNIYNLESSGDWYVE